MAWSCSQCCSDRVHTGWGPSFKASADLPLAMPPHEVIPQECIHLLDAASQDWVPVSVHGMKVVAALMLGLLVTCPLTSLNLRFFLFSRFRVILTHLMLDPDIYVHGSESLFDMVGL